MLYLNFQEKCTHDRLKKKKKILVTSSEVSNQHIFCGVD